MTPPPSKAAILQALLATIRERIAHTQSTLVHAQASATDGEARAENKYDTRGLEMSYVAAGQTDRIGELRKVLSAYHFWEPPDADDVIRPGALVLTSRAGATRWLYVAPFGDAEELVVDGERVQVITLRAPLGRALTGKEEGDEISVMGGTWLVERVL